VVAIEIKIKSGTLEITGKHSLLAILLNIQPAAV
jgi:hypothetical protein